MDERKTTQKQPERDVVEIDLLRLTVDFFRIAKRKWWLFFLLIALGIGGMFGFNFGRYTPLYRCEATFTVSTGENSSFYYSSTAANQMASTFPYILDSSYFRSVLLDALGTERLNGTISAQTIENSNMVTMAVSSASAADARAILEAALAVYPEVSRFVLGDIEFHLIDEIQTPSAPYNTPSLYRIIALGGFGGFVVAAAIVLLIAFFNNTVKTVEDMERFSSLECLGALPEVKQKARKNSVSSRYVSMRDPRTPHGYRESISSLTIRLCAAMDEQDAKTLLVTSSVAGEGKSMLSVNLAEQLAQEGKRVMLIDLDLRRQQDARILGLSGGATVTEVLRNPELQETKFIRFSKKIGFFFWGGEKVTESPAEFLASPDLRVILKQLRAQVDYLILDTPPCALFQDAAMLADCADSVLLVVRHDAVPANKVKEALAMLDAAKTPVLGYVFNAFPQSSGHYGYGRYGYGKYGYGGYKNYGGYREPAEDVDADAVGFPG